MLIVIGGVAASREASKGSGTQVATITGREVPEMTRTMVTGEGIEAKSRMKSLASTRTITIGRRDSREMRMNSRPKKRIG